MLPYIDSHSITCSTGPAELYEALVSVVDKTLSRPAATAYARAVRCVPSAAGGPRPLAPGSTVPGFRVLSAANGDELVLAGRHVFSTYLLRFAVTPDGSGGSRLVAESRAEFHGVAGRGYRLLVLRTGFHAVSLGHLLRTVKRRAEHNVGSARRPHNRS